MIEVCSVTPFPRVGEGLGMGAETSPCGEGLNRESRYFGRIAFFRGRLRTRSNM